MRILAIRGENIASLADWFEIDLTAEPLGTAGLFAITGQTGAGKSSILDAMCLALYANCPRLSSGGGKDKVTDADGSDIQSSDPRLVLRRGASEGMAEVDFLAIDGKAYRATWGARRARNKANGKLQGVSRSLVTIADGQVIETQLTQVNARVADLTALSYDEFRRTVLLSQGDFDAFLRAETNDRAALLEKVTGTSLYRDISVRVHQKTAAAKEVIDRLQLRRAETSAMTDEEREAVENQISALQNAAQQCRAERQQVEAGITHFKAVATAQTGVETATQVLSDRHKAHADAAPQRDQLAAIDAAATLRPQYDRYSRAAASLARNEKAAAEAGAASAAADQATTEAKSKAAEARDQAQAQEQVFKSFASEWDKAAALDARLDAAAEEVAASATNLDQAGQAVAAKAQELAAHQAAHDAAQQSMAAAIAAKPADFAALAPHWGVIAQALEDRKTLSRALADAETTRTSAMAQVANLKTALTDIGKRLTAANATCDDAASKASGIEAEATTLAATATDQALDDLATTRDRIADAVRSQRNWSAAKLALAAQQQALATAETAKSVADAQIAQTTTALTTAKAQVAALQAPALHAEIALGDAAREMRAHLVDGQPCPVCGATEHPTAADHALAEIAASLGAQLAAARGNEADAQTKLDAARHDSLKAAQSATAASAAIAAAKVDIDAAVASYPQGLPPIEAVDGLAASQAENQTALATLRATRDKVVQLRNQVATLVRARDDAQAARDTIATQQHDHQRQLDRAEAAVASATQGAADLVARIAQVDARLSPYLDATQITDDATLAKLTAMHDIWTRSTESEARAKADLAVIDPAINTARANCATATATRDGIAAQLDERQRKLADLRSARAGMLGGEATNEHRSRINRIREAAHVAAQSAETALHVTMSSAAQRAEAMAYARNQLIEARSEMSEATAALQGQDIAALQRLFAMEQGQVDQLRQMLRGLDDAIIAATAQLNARLDAQAALLSQPEPELPLPELEAALATLEQADTERQQQIGGARAQLAADDERRRALGSLDQEIAAAKAHFDVWDAVNRAVGSANGDKFARHAQKITLDLLVEKANLHLAQLRPRYRLQSSGAELGLHVIDRDMADEVRSTRSLSGGERFLISLALALALSTMGSRGGLAGTLFIDEGFGSLDGESLDLAIDALEALQSQGRTVGVISHVEALKDRIPVQLRVKQQGNGRSTISMHAPHFGAT